MAKKININVGTYLSKNFTSSFMTVFLPLFFIGSLVFIIKISAMTASIKVTFLEMLQLFSYNLASILFYILPVSFLVAVVITLLRLSNDNELMALFALGTKASSLLNKLFFLATLFTLLLLILSLALMPKSKQQFKAFQVKKASQAQLNINPSKLGQKFGDLFIYVKSKDKNSTMKNIVIYKKENNDKSKLFIAKTATFKTEASVVTLSLHNGSGYTYSKDRLEEIEYETMNVFRNISSEAFTYNNIVNYWTALQLTKKKSRIFFFIFTSFIPIMGLLFVAAFSIINPRYNKNYAYPILGAITVVFYALASVLEKQGTVIMTFGLIASLMFMGYWLFKRNVLRFF